MTNKGNSPAGTADGPRLQRWLKTIPLITSAVSGVLALVPKLGSILGPFDYTGEVLLGICALGIMVFAAGMIREEGSVNKPSSSLFSRRTIGISVMVASPIVALILWYTVLRLPPQVAAQVATDVQLGDTELSSLDNPSGAIEYYNKALALAPRKASIRAKLKIAEAQKRERGQ
jgi:hypothetical protein